MSTDTAGYLASYRRTACGILLRTRQGYELNDIIVFKKVCFVTLRVSR